MSLTRYRLLSTIGKGMKKAIIALTLIGAIPVLLLNSAFLGGPTHSTHKIDLNSGQIKYTKLFLSFIPYSVKIEDTFLSKDFERTEKRNWMIYGAKRPNIGISYTFKVTDLLTLNELIKREEIAFEKEALNTFRSLILEKWKDGDFYYHADICRELDQIYLQSWKTPEPMSVITSGILRAAQSKIDQTEGESGNAFGAPPLDVIIQK